MILVSIQGDINVSLQVGDAIYTTLLTNDQAGVNTTSGHKPILFGFVVSIDDSVIGIDQSGISPTPPILTSEHYLFFSKNRAVNTSGVLGYYVSVEYRNYSKKKAEIFATGTEYAPSSK